MSFRSLAVALAAISFAAAFPTESHKSHRRQTTLSSTGLAKLESLGFQSDKTGYNADASGSQPVWIGSDGPYTVEYTNNSPDEVVLVVWNSAAGYSASFVTAVQPLITVSLEGGGDTVELSFEDSTSGAWAGVYTDTNLTQYGQIQNTWIEYTMSPTGVVDVSQEVYTEGNSMEIVGPDCTANLSECYYTCTNGQTTCGDAGTYALMNCAVGAQPGNAPGSGGASGGCGWESATAVAFTSTFS